jgi:acetate kinase
MEEGLVRYGFHGLSYEYIASVLPEKIDVTKNKKIIVAHLGNGASMCALYALKSLATSMGLTALDGLMMGSRCGSIDPGLILYLLQEKKQMPEQITHLLYNESGLLGVSGMSSDVRRLIESDKKTAKEAIDLFCYRATREIGALAAVLQGCDALVFTAGIGENSPIIRKKIVERLTWMGIQLDDSENNKNSEIISNKKSGVIVSVIKTNEEYMMAKHTSSVCKENNHD